MRVGRGDEAGGATLGRPPSTASFVTEVLLRFSSCRQGRGGRGKKLLKLTAATPLLLTFLRSLACISSCQLPKKISRYVDSFFLVLVSQPSHPPDPKQSAPHQPRTPTATICFEPVPVAPSLSQPQSPVSTDIAPFIAPRLKFRESTYLSYARTGRSKDRKSVV